MEGRRESRPVGQEVKTPASHAGNMGSIPIRVTTSKRKKKTWVGKKDNQGSKAQKAYYTSAVSYTHLTLPTKRIVYISVVAVSLKKFFFKQKTAYEMS